MNSVYSNYTRYQISAETDNFDFLDQICSKRVFPVSSRKSKQRNWILNIRIKFVKKFELKLAILIFWTKFAQRKCFLYKTEKVSSAIEFCIFELAYVQNFSLNWQFSFFGPSLSKKGISSLKRKK